VRLGTKVDALTRQDDCYILTAGDRRFEADRVVVASGPFQKPRVPAFVSKLDPAIMQLHSSEYRNPTQLQTGDTLVVGVGNSGAEIALELAKTRRIWLSGRETGHIPQIRNRSLSRLYWWFIHKFLNIDRGIGRRFKAAAAKKGAPLVGISNKDFEHAGVERVPRTVDVQDGQPLLEDGRVLDVTNVVWATGFILDFSWIKLPVFGADDYPVHYRGVVESEPGLYFIGLPFLYTLTSALIGGARRDAEYIAKHIATQSKLPDSMAPTREEQVHEFAILDK
jgi:putative flavoprotein involved in K+ transport